MSRWARIPVVLSLLLFPGCAWYERAITPNVPQSLRPPTDQKFLLRAYAKGVQIYRCEPSPTDPTQFVWTLKAPEAMLFDEQGIVIGSHYAGPTWESAGDHSKVVGTVKERTASPDSGTIPWLLLQAKSTEGPGLFPRVTSIQRVNTHGGLAPTNSGDRVGQEVRAHYTADYYFYRAKP